VLVRNADIDRSCTCTRLKAKGYVSSTSSLLGVCMLSLASQNLRLSSARGYADRALVLTSGIDMRIDLKPNFGESTFCLPDHR
jgi:hypothetical protein